MSPRSSLSQQSFRSRKPAVDDLPPDLRPLLHDLHAGAFDLLGRVRPVHDVVNRQIVAFDRLQDGGLDIADIIDLLSRLGIVGANGKPVRASTLRSALSRARKVNPGFGTAAGSGTMRRHAASGRVASLSEANGSDVVLAAAERGAPQPMATSRAGTPRAAARRSNPWPSEEVADATQRPALTSSTKPPADITGRDERSSVQARATLWNNASKS